MNHTILPNAQHESEDPVATKLLNAAQYTLVVVFGLLPIFFIPLAAAPFAYAKTLFVIVGLAIALILYSFAALRVGEMRLRIPLPLMFLWGVAAVAGISALFSGDMHDALIGNAFEVQTGGFILLLALTATVWSCFGSNRVAVMRMFLLLAVSTLILALFHISRIVFGSDVLTLGLFGGNTTASLFGGWNDLGIFFGLIVIIALTALEQLSLSRVLKSLFIIAILLSLSMLALVNFTAIWFILGLVSLIVIIYSIRRGRSVRSEGSDTAHSTQQDHTALFLSIAVFLVSVLFVIAGSFLSNSLSRITDVSYVEVRPSFSATTEITRAVYQENAILGVGPNRFADAYRNHKDPAINSTAFWAVDFGSGVGYIPTTFITIGVLGGLLWILFLLSFILKGIRTHVEGDKNSRIWYFIGTASFVGGIYIWGVTFFYAPGPALLLLGAMFVGLAITSHDSLRKHATRSISLGSSAGDRMSFVLIALATMLIIGSISALYFVGKHYTSVYTFNTSTIQANNGAGIDTVERTAVRAFNLFEDDRYARRIAEYQLARIVGLLQAQNPTDEQRTQFSNAIANGREAGTRATELDGSDPNNWMVLGNVYYALVSGGVEGAYELALDAFQRARTLDPHNPARVLALAQLELANGDNQRARDLARTAVDMKPNYREAVYFLSQVHIILGDLEEALAGARNMTVLEPNNPVHYFQIGLMEMSFGNTRDYVAAFERAVALEPDYANARYYLALGYDLLERPEDARAQLQRVLELNPGNEQVGRLLTALNEGERLIDVDATGAAEGTPADTEPPVEESEDVTETEDGTVITDEDPDSPLLSPVNAGSNEGSASEEETATSSTENETES